MGKVDDVEMMGIKALILGWALKEDF
jgi:hypothetical protein